jgi:TP901 family phage tail tape measure protein
VLQLAAAGNMDLATTADIASNVLSGYGMEVGELGRVNDVLAVTFSNTNTNIAQAGEAMKYVAPVAAAAGMEFEEAAAAVGLLGNAGIQGSMAGTTLRGVITALINPTGEAADILERLGIQALDSSGNMIPLADIIDQLGAAGVTTGELMTVFGQRAGPGLAALLEQGGRRYATRPRPGWTLPVPRPRSLLCRWKGCRVR